MGDNNKITVDAPLELESEMLKLANTSKRVKLNIGTFFGDNYWDFYLLPSIHFTHWQAMETRMGNKIPGENIISFRFLFFLIELTIIERATI